MVWNISRFFQKTGYPQEVEILEKLYQNGEYEKLRDTTISYIKEGIKDIKINTYLKMAIANLPKNN